MNIAILNYIYDAEYTTVDALLERYLSLTGWADSLLAAGVRRVTVLQRFDRDIDLRRDGVEYLLRRGACANRRSWSDPRRLHRAVVALRPDVAHVNGLIFPAQTWLLRRALPRESALIVQDHGGPPPAPRDAGGLLPPWRRLRFEMPQAGLRAAAGLMFTTAAQAQPWRASRLVRPPQPACEGIESGRARPPLAPA